MKKWILSLVVFCSLLFSVVGFAYNPILSVVPSSTASIIIPTSGSASLSYTVTNNVTKSVNNLQITPGYQATGVISASVSNNTCTGSLAASASCTFTVTIQGVTAGASRLMPRVCVLNGLNCSVPINTNRVTVTTKTLQSIAVTPSPASVNGVGNTVQFTATGTYTDNTTGDITTAVTWASSDTAKATIGSSTGLATAVAAGTTSITATSGSTVSSGVTLTVTTAPTLTSIAITPTSPTNIRRLATQQFTATGTYSDSSTADITTSVSWASSNTTSATIGLHTGLLSTTATVGSTNITASLNSVTSNTVSMDVIDFAYITNYNAGGASSYVSYCPVSNSDGSLGTCTNVLNAGAGNNTFNGVNNAVINPAATFLYVVNYDNGSVSYCPLNADGSLGTCTTITDATFANSSSLVFTPSGDYVNVVHERAVTSLCSVSGGAFSSCGTTGPDPGGVIYFAGIALNGAADYAYLTDYTGKVYSCGYTASTGVISSLGSCTVNDDFGVFGRVYGVLVYPTLPRIYITRLRSPSELLHCNIVPGTGAVDISSCATDDSASGTEDFGHIGLNSQRTKLYTVVTDYGSANYVVRATVDPATGNLSNITQLIDPAFSGIDGIAVG